jgi:hypothetical protein
LRAKAVKRRQRAACRYFEDRAAPINVSAGSVATAVLGRPVEVSVGAFDQPRDGMSGVRTTGLRAKAVKRRQHTTRSYFEDRAAGDVTRTIDADPANKCCSVKVPIGALDYCVWVAAVRATSLLAKAVKRRQHTACSHFEDRAAPGRPTGGVVRTTKRCCPIEVPVT